MKVSESGFHVLFSLIINCFHISVMKNRDKTEIKASSMMTEGLWKAQLQGWFDSAAHPVPEGTGSLCFPWCQTGPRTDCFHDIKLLQFQALICASHRPEEKMFLLVALKKGESSFSRNPSKTSLVSYWPLNTSHALFQNQCLPKITSKVIDLGLDNRIKFKNKKMVLSGLI